MDTHRNHRVLWTSRRFSPLTKVGVAVFRTEGGGPEVLERFFSQGPDVLFDEGVGESVLSVIQTHGVQMDVRSTEPELRCLMIAGLDGDAASHRSGLEKLEPPVARLGAAPPL